jgi:predicted nucleic acid-binding protein
VIVIADTSGLIAASDKNAAEAADCRTVLAESGAVIISPLVLTEVDHLAKSRFGATARTAIIDAILFQTRRGRFEIPAISLDFLETARKVQRRYSALDLDLADGVTVALAAEYRTDVVLTLDRRDFRAMRPRTPHPNFRLLPDDPSGA